MQITVTQSHGENVKTAQSVKGPCIPPFVQLHNHIVLCIYDQFFKYLSKVFYFGLPYMGIYWIIDVYNKQSLFVISRVYQRSCFFALAYNPLEIISNENWVRANVRFLILFGAISLVMNGVQRIQLALW